MNILLCSPTFHQHTHGPSNFIRQLYFNLQGHQDVQPYVLTEKCELTQPEIFHYQRTPFRVKGFGLKPQSKIIADRILALNQSLHLDIIVFTHAVYALDLLHKRYNHTFKIAVMINDDEFLRIDYRNPKVNPRWLYHAFHRKTEQKVAREADHVIANSNYILQQILANYSKVKAVSIVGRAIDLDKFYYAPPRAIADDPIKVLFVKSDFIRGGLKQLVLALSALSHLYKFSLTVIGPPVATVAKHLNRWSVGTHFNLQLHGPASQDQVAAAMHQAHILCIPSLREGLGVANLEGLACGLRIVSTKVGGIPETLNHGLHGWLCLPESIESLKEALVNSINSSEQAVRKSLAGRGWVEANCTHNKVTEAFLSVCRHTIKTTPSSSKE